jgi:hypothetical protein
MFTWFWSALVTLIVTVTEGLLPSLSDPLTVADKVEQVAEKANANTKIVLALRELQAHPAALNPFKTLRELWLDRAILFGLLVLGSFQFFTFLNVFFTVSLWWFVVPLGLLMPIFIFYARSVRSEVQKSQEAAFHAMPTAARITNISRIIHGHTHVSKHVIVEGLEYLNTGTWSPAFRDPECKEPYGQKCFAWIKPPAAGDGPRVAELHEWKTGKASKIEMTFEEVQPAEGFLHRWRLTGKP